MDEELQRLERAKQKNLEYLRRKEQQEYQEYEDQYSSSALKRKLPRSNVRRSSKKKKNNIEYVNTSIYVSGLKGSLADKQLEGACSTIGTVRRIKFYKDEQGNMKGDALVTFQSVEYMEEAIRRLNNYEIVPGCCMSVSKAEFKPKHEESCNPPTSIDEHSSVNAAGDSNASPESSIDPVVFDPASKKSSSLNPSNIYKTVVLKNIFDSNCNIENKKKFFGDLEEDMRNECSKHGSVTMVECCNSGEVRVSFSDATHAMSCLKQMDGRFFDGRKILAEFDKEIESKSLDNNVSKGEPSMNDRANMDKGASNMDDRAMLDAFFAYIG